MEQINAGEPLPGRSPDPEERADDYEPIPNPPEGGIPTGDGVSRPAGSIEELMSSLNDFAKNHGFAVIRNQGSNKRKETGEYTRWSLRCDRDDIRPSKSVGLRKSATQKVSCPWKGIATSKRADAWGWL